MIKRNWKIILLLPLITIFWWTISIITNPRCTEITEYTWGNDLLLIRTFPKLFLIWTISLVLIALPFKKIRDKINPRNPIRFKYIYFSIAFSLTLSYYIAIIPGHLMDASFIKGICEKNKDQGHFTNLSLEEYQYLTKKNSLFPKLPANARNIETKFWGDSFLGDHFLEVICTINATEKTDTSYWKITKKDSHSITIHHEESSN